MKINKRLLGIIIGLFIFLIVVSALLDRFIPKNQTPTLSPISLITPTEQLTNIFPTSPITLTFTGSPQVFRCTVTTDASSQIPQFNTTSDGNTLVLSSDVSWPEGKLLSFLVSCQDFSAKVNVSIQGIESMTEEEQFKVGAKDEINTALAREEYMNSHPYVESFPLMRDTYAVFLLDVQQVLYISPKSGQFSEEQKAQIEKKEREEVRKLGVPDYIPFTFTAPKN